MTKPKTEGIEFLTYEVKLLAAALLI